MREKSYYRLIHINLPKDLSDYLSWKTYNLGKNKSDIVRELIRADMEKDSKDKVVDKEEWINAIMEIYSSLLKAKNI